MVDDGEANTDSRHKERDDEYAVEWKPSLVISVIWTVLALGVSVGALLLLTSLNQVLHGGNGFFESTIGSVERYDDGSTAFTINLLGVGILLVLIAFVLVLHELIHGMMFRMFGGRPRYGAAVHNYILPVLYCTAHGYRFTKRQFVAIVLAPAVLITLPGLLLMGIPALAPWVAVPVAMNLGGAIGDFWMAGMLIRAPEGTLIEDREDGLRFYPSDDDPGLGTE